MVQPYLSPVALRIFIIRIVSRPKVVEARKALRIASVMMAVTAMVSLAATATQGIGLGGAEGLLMARRVGARPRAEAWCCAFAAAADGRSTATAALAGIAAT
jgi:hypothetical protein